MRRLPLLLLLAGIAVADDPFPEKLRAFEEARPFMLQPGGQARVNPAVEGLASTGDVRAVSPLAAYLLETIAAERRIQEDGIKVQKEYATSAARAQTLEGDLKRLELKERAGDRTVGPEIERCRTERAQCLRRCDQIEGTAQQTARVLAYIQDLRGRLVDACISLLNGRKGADAALGIEGIRRALDPADREQGLILVRILASSDVEKAEDQLIEILTAPKAEEAVRLRAQLGLQNHITRRGAETLLRLWEKDPNDQRARHVLSLAAKRHLESVEDARAWIATLP